LLRSLHRPQTRRKQTRTGFRGEGKDASRRGKQLDIDCSRQGRNGPGCLNGSLEAYFDKDQATGGNELVK